MMRVLLKVKTPLRTMINDSNQLLMLIYQKLKTNIQVNKAKALHETNIQVNIQDTYYTT
jgi:hypothetical protein